MCANNLAFYIENLSLNQSKRFNSCPWCGKGSQRKSSDTFFVATHKQNYYLLHCFKCNRTRKLKKGSLSISEVNHLKSKYTAKAEPRNIEHYSVKLPPDFTTDIPMDGLLWLKSFNISADERAAYNIGYSPSYGRVILPAYSEDGVLIYWQGRKVGNLDGSPKYLNLKRKDSSKQFFYIVSEDSDVVVLVEDILSAIAISRAGYNAIALLGTHLPDEVAMNLDYARIIIWLDPDKKQLSQQYAKRLRAFGKESKAIVSHTKDPKTYTPQQIKNFVEK